MSARVHVHLHVSDLARSREFYQKFLGVAPGKEKPDYVKFLPELVPISLGLSKGPPTGGGEGPVSHMGIVVDSTGAVFAHLARVKAAGLPVREEIGVDCCHANLDRFWVRDPDGVEWEIYHVNHDLEDEGIAASTERPQRAASAAGLPLTKDESCCSPEPSERYATGEAWPLT